jgi:hypothetical protein
VNEPQRRPEEIFNGGVREVGPITEGIQVRKAEEAQHLQAIRIWLIEFIASGVVEATRGTVQSLSVERIALGESAQDGGDLMRTMTALAAALSEFDELSQSDIGRLVHTVDPLVEAGLEDGMGVFEVASAKAEVDLRPDWNASVEIPSSSGSASLRWSEAIRHRVIDTATAEVGDLPSLRLERSKHSDSLQTIAPSDERAGARSREESGAMKHEDKPFLSAGEARSTAVDFGDEQIFILLFEEAPRA